MANISSFFGGSGGSGLSTDFTKNDYGVPLPEYITCITHKSSCTITVCPGYTFDSNSKGFSQGGITNVRDNIFIATGVEHPFTNSDCTKIFAMAFCVNDDTGAIVSGMTEFKCVFQSASTNDRFAGETQTPGVGDGCCRAYYGHACSGCGSYTILCTNSSFNCIGTSSATRYGCSAAGGSTSLVYNGVPGSVLAHAGNNEDQNSFIRFCNGNVCFNNNLGNSLGCTNCFASSNLRGKYALSPNTILLTGIFMCGGDCICHKTILFQWNDANDCYRMAYCKGESGSQVTNSNYVCCILCCHSPGHVLGTSFRVGPTFYPEGGGASFYHEPDCQNCIRQKFCVNGGCCRAMHPHSVLLNWEGQNHWNMQMKGTRGKDDASSTCYYATNNDFTMNWVSNSSCISNRVGHYVGVQQNGVLGAGIAQKSCFAFNCGNFGQGTRQETYGSWSTPHGESVRQLYQYPRTALRSYPIPQFCNCYQTCCFHFLASQVVGCKWIVTMESSQCCQCECVTLHAYKIMTNSCTAD